MPRHSIAESMPSTPITRVVEVTTGCAYSTAREKVISSFAGYERGAAWGCGLGKCGLNAVVDVNHSILSPGSTTQDGTDLTIVRRDADGVIHNICQPAPPALDEKGQPQLVRDPYSVNPGHYADMFSAIGPHVPPVTVPTGVYEAVHE
jgi:hypothetical protein